ARGPGQPRGGEQLARLPAGADEVDARRPARGVAVLQLGQFFPAGGCLLDAESGFAALGGLLAAQPLALAADLVGDGLLAACLGVEECGPALGELVGGTSSPEVTAGESAADLDHRVCRCPQSGPVICGHHIAASW